MSTIESMKAEHRHRLIVLILFGILYLGSFLLLELFVKEPMLILYSPLDDYIPFSRFALIPYCLWFPSIAVTLYYFFLKAPEEEYRRLALPLIFGSLSVMLFYALVPNGVNLRPAVIEGDDPLAVLTRLLQGFDPPINTCPSLHVLIMVLMDNAWQRSAALKGKTGIKAALRLLDLSVCLSTVFLKQHSILDVFWALVYVLVLEAAASYICKKKEQL